jgi:sterol desaturase/sphingolipid hydroxylase (fatty acid hydroxylase superfamily)
MHYPQFWWIHKDHHLDNDEPTWFDTNKGHILENLLLPIGFFIPSFFGYIDIYQMLIALLYLSIKGMFRHDKRTSWIDGGHHLRHHKVYNKNYGEPWLDYIFNTTDKYNPILLFLPPFPTIISYPYFFTTKYN